MPLFWNDNQGLSVGQQHGLARSVTAWRLLADDVSAQTLGSPPPAESVGQDWRFSSAAAAGVALAEAEAESKFVPAVHHYAGGGAAAAARPDRWPVTLSEGLFLAAFGRPRCCVHGLFWPELLYILFGAALILCNFPLPVKEPCGQKKKTSLLGILKNSIRQQARCWSLSFILSLVIHKNLFFSNLHDPL